MAAFLATVFPVEARDRVSSESGEILSRCVNPGTAPNRRAGLVIGYVQSGKTTSMMATAALGKDNGFGLVILIAGTSEILLNQSRVRFTEALGLDATDAYRRWVHFPSPKSGSDDVQHLAAELESWLDPVPGGDRPTVIVTVMKQKDHLQELGAVLRGVADQVDLSRIPALVFDDEADQASLNLRRKPGDESATYRYLREIRDELPWHTLLQYTATPQAPLLISIADELSPEFTYLLDPGDGYVGGQYFFIDKREQFVRHIPPDESHEEDEPPPSLLEALAFFALGAAIGLVDRSQRDAQRSMLVHPSRETEPHAKSAYWVGRIKTHWAETLALPEESDDRQDLIAELFVPAYKDLRASRPTIPELPALLTALPGLLKRLRVQEVNRGKSGSGPSIDWPSAYAWVLVGGQLLDRGYTVRGLTVTYMPRGKGVGNADTLQQRARFFGYKRNYAHLCRAWLDPDVASSFEAYVEHEESVRSQLAAQLRSGKSLRDWKRVFLLSRELKPTRAAVIRLSIERPSLGDDWFDQHYVVANGSDINSRNGQVTGQFLGGLALLPSADDPRLVQDEKNKVGHTSLRALFEGLLSQFTMYEGDQPGFTALQLVVDEHLERDGDRDCLVYEMSGGNLRSRTIRPNGSVELMQGRNPSDPSLYPGDREFRERGTPTVQLHRLKVRDHDGSTLEDDVWALAMWVPSWLAADVVVER